MKIFSREQIAVIDLQTRIEEPVSEIDLMERASVALAEWLISNYSPTTRMAVFAGPGNNGGDALAVTRLLTGQHFNIDLYLPSLSNKQSEAFLYNMERLSGNSKVRKIPLKDRNDLVSLSDYELIVDGLYGSGLNRPLEGFAGTVIDWINKSGVEVVSIDLPSGMLCDRNHDNNGTKIHASVTLTLGFPKLALFFGENEPCFGRWEVIRFGLSEKVLERTRTSYFFVEPESVSVLLKKRKIFAHKGSFGHGLLLSGSAGKYGAAVLAARGALRSGMGLLTVHLPASAGMVLNISIPEAMTSLDPGHDFLTLLPELSKFAAIAAGPGIGTHPVTAQVIRKLVEVAEQPMVLDADALNHLSDNPQWLEMLPFETILTPHPAEFSRLAGKMLANDEERFVAALDFARRYQVILVLKGAFTRIFFPDGTVSFNSTGNPGMATAGCGDVLTGILLGLQCQGYSPREAAILGVFLHGRAADICVEFSSQESLMAGDISEYLGMAFASLK